MPSTTRLALVLIALAALAFGASCSDGEREPQSTPSAARAERGGDGAERAVQQAEQPQPAAQGERGADSAQAPAAADAAAVISEGRRAGLTALRNVVGDPEAPVLVVEYSDFQ